MSDDECLLARVEVFQLKNVDVVTNTGLTEIDQVGQGIWVVGHQEHFGSNEDGLDYVLENGFYDRSFLGPPKIIKTYIKWHKTTILRWNL